MSLRNKSVLKTFTLIILSAGEGKRFAQLSGKLPKTLLKLKALGNRPILQVLIESFYEQGIESFIIIIGYLGHEITHFIDAFISKKRFLKEKITIIDASPFYKKGPLYSFYSIFTRSSSIKKDANYILIPGDTIFDRALIEHVMNIIKRENEILKKYPLLFYRQISLPINHQALISEDISSLKTISIIEITRERNLEFLKKINNMNPQELMKYSSEQNIYQLIPIIVFGSQFLNQISALREHFKKNTLKDLLNFLIQTKNARFILKKVDHSLNFHDIDSSVDVEMVEKEYINKIKKD
ncbi:MAG: NTP transferase domain-containing protein [Promethearchaeota archaeon]